MQAPLVVLAELIDWALVRAGIHRAPMSRQSVSVVLAAWPALAFTPVVVRWLAPRLPTAWWTHPLLRRRRRNQAVMPGIA